MRTKQLKLSLRAVIALSLLLIFKSYYALAVSGPTVGTISLPFFNSSGSYTLNWSGSVTTVTAYQYYESQVIGIFESPGPTINNGLSKSVAFTNKPSGDYKYYVRACNGLTCSAFKASNVISVNVVANTTPTISNITDQSIDEASNTGDISFTVGDSETSAGLLTLSASSSNTGLVPVSNITFGGSGANRTVKVTPVASGTGTATISVMVSDGSLSASDSFVLTVVATSNTPDWAKTSAATVPDAPLVAPSVPNQEAVGALEGQGGVSGGSASYSIPIALVPGRAGMQPGVSLNYSSRGGNGLAGVGWSISAGSSIHRCAATQAQDGFTASPQYGVLGTFPPNVTLFAVAHG